MTKQGGGSVWARWGTRYNLTGIRDNTERGRWHQETRQYKGNGGGSNCSRWSFCPELHLNLSLRGCQTGQCVQITWPIQDDISAKRSLSESPFQLVCLQTIYQSINCVDRPSKTGFTINDLCHSFLLILLSHLVREESVKTGFSSVHKQEEFANKKQKSDRDSFNASELWELKDFWHLVSLECIDSLLCSVVWSFLFCASKQWWDCWMWTRQCSSSELEGAEGDLSLRHCLHLNINCYI